METIRLFTLEYPISIVRSHLLKIFTMGSGLNLSIHVLLNLAYGMACLVHD